LSAEAELVAREKFEQELEDGAALATSSRGEPPGFAVTVQPLFVAK
jgi:hypothetical protein